MYNSNYAKGVVEGYLLAHSDLPKEVWCAFQTLKGLVDGLTYTTEGTTTGRFTSKKPNFEEVEREPTTEELDEEPVKKERKKSSMSAENRQKAAIRLGRARWVIKNNQLKEQGLPEEPEPNWEEKYPLKTEPAPLGEADVLEESVEPGTEENAPTETN